MPPMPRCAAWGSIRKCRRAGRAMLGRKRSAGGSRGSSNWYRDFWFTRRRGGAERLCRPRSGCSLPRCDPAHRRWRKGPVGPDQLLRASASPREPKKAAFAVFHAARRSEEQTSELQPPMRISYAVFRLKTKTILTQELNYYTIFVNIST